MKKSEICAVILDTVCGCTEVEKEDLLSRKRTEEVVIARCLAVVYLRDAGMSRRAVCEKLHLKSVNSVPYFEQMYADRKKTDKNFRYMEQYASHELDKEIAARCQ